ncbi:hypothetical protein [Scytonema sp. NUACC21]
MWSIFLWDLCSYGDRSRLANLADLPLCCSEAIAFNCILYILRLDFALCQAWELSILWNGRGRPF